MSTADKYTTETITDVRPWTDNLFSFRTTRDRGYRFTPGQFHAEARETQRSRPLNRWILVVPEPVSSLLFATTRTQRAAWRAGPPRTEDVAAASMNEHSLASSHAASCFWAPSLSRRSSNAAS